MDNLSWTETKRLVYQRANGYCEYCQTTDRNTGQTMHIEHIDPNGGNLLNNLCLSCANCNLRKAIATTGTDPDTHQEAPLFNPRQQNWTDHFGRATISRLKMNQSLVVNARWRWVKGGFHPPAK